MPTFSITKSSHTVLGSFVIEISCIVPNQPRCSRIKTYLEGNTVSTKQRRQSKAPFSYIFLAPEGTINSWELFFETRPGGPRVIRGQTNYFEGYLPLVRLARKYRIRYILCTTAFAELEKLPRSLRPYVIPEPMAFASPDVFGVLAYRHESLEDTVTHYARSRYLDRWLLIDSTYERRDIITPEYTSLACDPVEGLGNSKLLARVTEWLCCSSEAPSAPGPRRVDVVDKFSKSSPEFMSKGCEQ